MTQAAPPGADADALDAIVTFLARIGVAVREGEVRDPSFLPGVEIRDGGIVYDRARLRWPGDLLHEAGHIAVTPPARRAALSDRLDAHPDATPVSEVEAIAWSWAAALAIGIDPALVFHEHGYHGRSAALLATFRCGVYPGAAGLAAAGMTHGAADAAQGRPPYPHMQAWLRP